MNPHVSFVVPCYKLGHLLAECINSILSQSFSDFEVLIMDDCSPDSTPQVAESFHDPRIRYLRNARNLGHLENYNTGIRLSAGLFIWLISADDQLRSRNVLAEYVELMRRHPRVGYVFCPAMELANNKETLAAYSCHGGVTRVFRGRTFLRRLLDCNGVVASSGMVRRSCYETLGCFQKDLPYAGDWYLWCLFALQYDVGYVAEPMVSYRIHENSMTAALMQEKAVACAREDLAVLWLIAARARQMGCAGTAAKCKLAIAAEYARQLVCGKYEGKTRLNLCDVRKSIATNAATASDANWIRARAYSFAADRYFHRHDFLQASDFYRLALTDDARMLVTRAKALLLRVGIIGKLLRENIFWIRRAAERLK